MKLVILECAVLQDGDLDWSGVRALPGVDEVVTYMRTTPDQIVPRIGDAELVILNKCRIDQAVLDRCPNIKWIGIVATGTDNLDLEACRRRGVAVANVPGYSTYSVAQMAFSLLLAVCQCADRQNNAVQAGYWQLGVPQQYGILPQIELYGKTLGIFGYGAIGQAAARIGLGFGMKVLVHTRTVRPEYADHGVEFVSFDELLARSQVISLHSPATPATRGIINAEALAKMRPDAILINTARGALVDEAAVAEACRSGKLGFYATDVLTQEPITPDNPLLGIPNVLISPHIAWTTGDALRRLAAITTRNLSSWLDGAGENVVNR